ncbi:MAG: SDR family oxidoreductase, partial [Planctomycetaceae bacterium]|nr:SDR family oxidoreductase [Planctomycetaceae bacterium]
MNMSGWTLLTGSTGVVGRLLLANLLKSQSSVAVLVRSRPGASAAERVERGLCRLEDRFQIRLPRPTVLEGDLTMPGLGLSPRDRDRAAKNCRRVLHSAASLSFAPASQHSGNEPYRTNLDGTRHLTEFCEQAGISEFHYVSTAYVCGTQTGSIAETPSAAQDFANDYERSKALAEEWLRERRPIRSLTIYRPSIVIDPQDPDAAETEQAITTAFATYQLLASKFGIPAPGTWLKNLGL